MLDSFDFSEFGLLHWLTLLAVTSLVLLAYLLIPKKLGRLDSRLQDLANKGETAAPRMKSVTEQAMSLLPSVGNSLLPKDDEQRTQLQARLTRAGFYGRQALVIYLGVKLLLTGGPFVLGLIAGLVGIVPLLPGMIFGALFGVFGMIAPSFWLDRRKGLRQTAFRRALPDAMDVLVICLEGGLNLSAGVRRVASELRTVHPELALEMLIVQREIQLGRTTGEALRMFAERSDLEEIRSLAGVINQAERFGASLAKALRVHADNLRSRRLQYAEEMAQKAAVKILFPTLMCIFPGIFLIILGPAAIQLVETFSRLRR